MDPVPATLTKAKDEFVSLHDISEEEGGFENETEEELSEK
jgi:hypothetical protein